MMANSPLLARLVPSSRSNSGRCRDFSGTHAKRHRSQLLSGFDVLFIRYFTNRFGVSIQVIPLDSTKRVDNAKQNTHIQIVDWTDIDTAG